MRKDLRGLTKKLGSFLKKNFNHDLVADQLKKVDGALDKEAQKKEFLILVKLLAGHIDVLKKFKGITPNKTKATQLLTAMEALFEEAFLELQEEFSEITRDFLGAEKFYHSPNALITTEDRCKILMHELSIQCAIAQALASNETASHEPAQILIKDISKAAQETKPSETLYATSVEFVRKAAKHFSSFSTPLLQSLQNSLVETLGKVAGPNAAYEAKDQIEASPDRISNASPFVAEGLRGFQARFAAGWIYVSSNDLQTFNSAYHDLAGLEQDSASAERVVKSLRSSMKALSFGARHLTGAVFYLQKSLSLILSPYLKTTHLNETDLSKLAGIFLELPFSNKDWSTTFARLRQNFSKLSYADKLKVIKALTERQIKKKDPSAIVSNLIWQAYASNPNGYADKSGNAQSSLQELNNKHYRFINDYPFLLESKRSACLSDLPDLFDYDNGARAKEASPLPENIQRLKTLADQKDTCQSNCDKIQEAQNALKNRFEDYSRQYKFALPENRSIEARLKALEDRYAELRSRPDALCTEEMALLRKLIADTKLTQDLKEKREHLNQQEGTRSFYSELLRGLSISLGAYRQIASGVVERRNVPTVFAGTFLDQLGSLLSMPVVSGILSGIGKAIETAGSLKLKHTASILSQITTTNSQLELLVEKITILLAYHLEKELAKYEPESLKKIARFCQERLLGLMLIHGEKEDWRDLDKVAEKYVRLVTEKMTEEDALVTKASLLFDSIKTLSVFRLKTVNPLDTRKTIAEMVTETPFALSKAESANKRRKPLPEKPQKRHQRPLSGGVETPFLTANNSAQLSTLQAELKALRQTVDSQKEMLDTQTQKIGQLGDRCNALETEKDTLKTIVESQEITVSVLKEEHAELKKSAQKNLAELKQELSEIQRTLAEQQHIRRMRLEAKLRDASASPYSTPVASKHRGEETPTPDLEASPEGIRTFTSTLKTMRTQQCGQYPRFVNPDAKIGSIRRKLSQDFLGAPTQNQSAENPSPNGNQNQHLVALGMALNEILNSEKKLCEFMSHLSKSFNSDEHSKIKQQILSKMGVENFAKISEKIGMIEKLCDNPFSEIKAIEFPGLSDSQLLELIETKLEAVINVIDSEKMAERAMNLINLTTDFAEVSDFVNDSKWKNLFDAYTLPTLNQPFSAIYVMPAQRSTRYKMLFDTLENLASKYPNSPSALKEKIKLGVAFGTIIGKASNAYIPAPEPKKPEPSLLNGLGLFTQRQSLLIRSISMDNVQESQSTLPTLSPTLTEEQNT